MWPISSRITLRVLRCIPYLTRGFTWWGQNYPSFSFSLASMIVNCYHHVTNKFPYHSTCFEMYTVTWGLTWWRHELSQVSMIINCYHHVTNKFPYRSTCFEMYTVYLRFHMVKTELSKFILFFSINDSSRITLHALRCIPVLEVSHGEDRIIASFFFVYHQWS